MISTIVLQLSEAFAATRKAAACAGADLRGNAPRYSALGLADSSQGALILRVGETLAREVSDGPGHIGVNTSKGMFFYNGNMYPESYERGGGGRAVGMGPLGVEHVGELGFVCRLVVLDAVAYRKSQGRIPAAVEMLPIPKQASDPGIITADDVQAIVKLQNLAEIGAGDCVACTPAKATPGAMIGTKL